MHLYNIYRQRDGERRRHTCRQTSRQTDTNKQADRHEHTTRQTDSDTKVRSYRYIRTCPFLERTTRVIGVPVVIHCRDLVQKPEEKYKQTPLRYITFTNPLPNDKVLELSKFKALADDTTNMSVRVDFRTEGQERQPILQYRIPSGLSEPANLHRRHRLSLSFNCNSQE